MTNFDYAAAIAAAAATSEDMNQAKTGGEYTPPAEGACLLRFVGYLELGKKETTFKGETKIEDSVHLVFELHGKNYPLNENGEPQRITVRLHKSLNEKARFYKLFRIMNYEGKARIFAQLLGGAYRGRVIHKKSTSNGKERVFVDLYDKDSGWTIAPPIVEDAETGETRKVNVPPAITPIKVFLWDHPSKEMWDSIYIDGEYPERKNEKGEVIAQARSKNQFQLAIKAAKNFKGSPIEALLEGVDDEALNSVGKTPEQAIAEKKATSEAAKASSSAAAGAAQQASSTASAPAAEPETSTAPSNAASKLPDQKMDPAGEDEPYPSDDELNEDLPF
ncbi:hypothetical protein KTE28_18460 [Burkholderia multivorans]|uniref:hypothetical protein n=1 Tax=Burkholderia multivorans TaxID=87883 RepID=UPI001C266C58|nr:hypothetical protein [Burkholderia multivorans]MBU9376312.1 hypothetical protein [Burkholderia multivorans]